MTRTPKKEKEVPVSTTDLLINSVVKLPSDYFPFGTVHRTEQHESCVQGCRWSVILGTTKVGLCCNPNSPRKGLLTLINQGCESFEAGDQREITYNELVPDEEESGGNAV